MSLEDQRLLSSYLPLLREFIPNAAEEVEADLIAHLGGHSKEGGYLVAKYTIKMLLILVLFAQCARIFLK